MKNKPYFHFYLDGDKPHLLYGTSPMSDLELDVKDCLRLMKELCIIVKYLVQREGDKRQL